MACSCFGGGGRPRRGGCRGASRRPPARNIGVVRGARLQLGIVERRTICGRDRQRLSSEWVLEGGEREDVVGKSPAVLLRQRVPVSWHWRAAQSGAHRPENVPHRRT